MKSKDYIIQKLLTFGKKHRMLKYPTLALVSVVSLFYALLDQVIKKPKRAVIAFICLILIVTQSWFLISMAADPDDGSDPMSGATDPATTLLTTPSPDTTTTYPISYYDPSAYTAVASQNLIEVATVTDADIDSLTLNTYAPVGAYADLYAFVGWSLQPGGAQTTVDEVKSVILANGSVSLYTIWERTKYRVLYEGDGGTLSNSSSPVQELLDVSSPGFTTKDAHFFVRTGYSYNNWKINNDPSNLIGTQVSTAVSDQDLTLSPAWNPITYQIAFDPGDGGTGTMDPVNATYDQTCNLPACAFTKQGYTFSGWTDENGHIYADSESVSNLKDTEGATITLTANWSYRNAVASSYSKTVTYGDGFSWPVDVYHTESDAGDFILSVTSVIGTSEDGAINTTADLGSIAGIVVDTSNHNQVIISSTGVTSVGQAVIRVQAEDQNNLNNGNKRLSYFDLTIVFGKRPLSVTGVETNTKTYDGTNMINVGSISYTDGVSTSIGDLAIYSEGQKGYFDDANVGTDKTLTLHNVFLSSATGLDQYYTVDTDASGSVVVPGGGTIEKRRVAVSTYPIYPGTDDFILAGMSPNFGVTVTESDLPDATRTADLAAITDAITGGANPNMNKFDCGYGPAANNYMAGTYSIGVLETDVEATLTNYDLLVSTGSLNVRQEEATKDDNYRISGHTGHPINGWYGIDEPTITPIGGYYDKVYVTTNSGAQIPTYDNGASFVDQVAITEDMSRANGLYVQLANSTTGAVTRMVPLESLHVDVTAPTVKEDTFEYVATNNTTWSRVGRFLSFGNFFKESLKVSFEVNDLFADGTVPDHSSQVSGVDGVTVILIPDGGTETEKQATITGGNIASFTIEKTFKGTIKLVTRDKAENQSTRATLLGMENGDIWVLEDQPPTISLSGTCSGAPIQSGSGNYYTDVTLSADVEDLDSGISYVEWTITKDGVDSTELTTEATSIVDSQTFTKAFTETGTYTVKIKAYDNATNVNEDTPEFSFIIDSTPPTVTLDPTDPDATWESSKTVKFSFTDSESGFSHFFLRGPDGRMFSHAPVDGEYDTYTFTTSIKGDYTITAYDMAGNITNEVITLNHVSDEVPNDPTLEVEGAAYPNVADDTDIEDDWYNTNPGIDIVEDATTPDGTRITCYYHLWEAGTTEPAYPNTRYTGTFNLPGEGIYNLRIWAETESGVLNAGATSDGGLYEIRYDGTKPVFTNVTVNQSSDNHKAIVTITEGGSGLDSLVANYTSGGTPRSRNLTFNSNGDGTYSATFASNVTGGYTLTATDHAGNSEVTSTIEPMGIKVHAVYINDNTTTVEGTVTAGTYDLTNVTVTYGETGGSSKPADTLVANKNAGTGDIAFTAQFTNLKYETTYDFLITGYESGGENCTYTGTFRVGTQGAQGRNLAGTVVDEELPATDTTTEIPITLTQNGITLQTVTAHNGDTFLFNNVPDGTYTIKAANEGRTANVDVLISGGNLIEPTNGSIRLILRKGQTTAVEYGGGASGYVVSGLDNFFGDSTNFGTVEQDAINNGGMVQFAMLITEEAESDVDPQDLALIKSNLRKGEVVVKYMDFTIMKRIYDEYGLVSESRVSELNGGKNVRVVIPLPSSVRGKTGLSVIRVHGGGASRLADYDTSLATYTLESPLYSTYALVYYDPSQNGGSTTAVDPSSTTTEPSTGSTTDPDPNGGSGKNTADDISKKNNAATPTRTSGKAPGTGDEAPILPVGILLGASLVTGGAILKKRKK